MATKEQINAACKQLDVLEQNFSEAFDRKDIKACDETLRQYFSDIRHGHAKGTVPDEELLQHIHGWKVGLLKLADIALVDAYFSADYARQTCLVGQDDVACDSYIVNTACEHVKNLAVKVFDTKIKKQSNFPLSHSPDYIAPIVGVLFHTAPYIASEHTREIFSDALSFFETMLYSRYFTPSQRYDIVSNLRGATLNSPLERDQLNLRLDKWLAKAVQTERGPMIILRPVDQLTYDEDLWRRAEDVEVARRQWQTMAKEEQAEAEAKQKPKLTIASAATVLDERSNAVVVSPHETIETAMQQQQYNIVENELFKLFQALAANPDNAFSHSYLIRAADNLADVSLKHAFQLSSRCIYAIEEENISSEPLQETVYEFSGLNIFNWEVHKHGDYSETHVLALAVMKRSSEFIHSEQSGDIFELAAQSYRGYLGSIHPTQRYDELERVANWLGEHKRPSPMLEDFVDDLMNSRILYGTFFGIPLEEDTRPQLWEVPTRSP